MPRRIRPRHKLPMHPMAAWKERHGPNSAHGFDRIDGWMVQTVGSYGGSAAAMQYLLWTPPVFGPDETSTCKYRKPVYNGDKPRLFENHKEAMDFYETVASKAQLVVNA